VGSHAKVSVIIPCFNLGEHLEEAVDSVLAQSCRDVEILVVDDGSTDPRTVELLAGFERPRTRLYRTENRGLPAARNFLIEHAGGEYLCALDADDKLHPSFLEKASAILDRDPSISFVSNWLEAFDDEQWLWKQERCDLPALLAEDTVMTAALVRREAVVEVGGYDEGMPAPGDEDWDLWIRLVEAGHRGTVIPEVLFFYRRRAGSMSTDCVSGETHLGLVRYLLDKHRQSYRTHLLDVLMWKERQIGELLRDNDRLERLLASQLEPTIERRRREIAQLRRKLQEARRSPPPRLQAWEGPALTERPPLLAGPEPALAEPGSALDAERRNLLHEIAALRGSWSWRLTAPLRRLHGLLFPPDRRR
jgi:glycosyltransferase involved in cell wall biosynthesis